MELRQEVARAIAASAESDEECWEQFMADADAVIARCGPRLLNPEDEAWKVAQLAATIMGTTWFYEGVGAPGAVEMALSILAEARRQTTSEPDRDAR